MPPKGAKKAKSSPAKKPVRTLSSLSSFQSTLSFGPSSKLTSSNSLPPSSRKEDAETMPPPPVPVRKEVKSSPAILGRKRDKGKSKAVEDDVEVIEIIESDDEVLPEPIKAVAGPSNAMWTDLFPPQSEADLAPGKARVSKVRDWLYEAVHGASEAAFASGAAPSATTRDRIRKYKRILLVTGPAGIGKTTTVRLIAKQLGIELAEWTEGVDDRSLGEGSDAESAVYKLTAFLARSAYPTLNMSGSSSRSRPRALLLTSLPNITHLRTRELFHSALLDFCKSYNPASCPLVIVHSDAGASGRAEESWISRERGGLEGATEVVGRDVREGPWCAEIDFLPLAPTFVTKALKRVLDLAVSDPSRRPALPAVQLIAQSSNGDLRSAINSLQLLCTGSGLRVPKKRKRGEPAPRASGRGSRGGKGAKLDVSEDIRAALDAVTRREQSLNLFHALGKVFYNKRLGDPSQDKEDAESLSVIEKLPPDDPLPDHLSAYNRRKSLVMIDSYIPTIPTDSSTLSLWLHHNMPAFCSDVSQMSAVMDDFCFADTMRTDDDIWQSSPQAISYALQLTVRGSLLNLPSPVPRASQKVTKPAFFEAFRSERDNASLLDVAAGHLAKKVVAANTAFADGAVNDEDDLVWGGVSSKTVLATETVPMAIKLQSQTRRPLLPIALQPLALPPYSSNHQEAGYELTERDNEEDDSLGAEIAGEDGMGVPDGEGWDVDEEADSKEKEDMGWLEEDDIEDWDD